MTFTRRVANRFFIDDVCKGNRSATFRTLNVGEVVPEEQESKLGLFHNLDNSAEILCRTLEDKFQILKVKLEILCNNYFVCKN